MAKNVNLAKVCNIKGVNKVLGMDAAGSAMRVCDGGSAQAPAKKKKERAVYCLLDGQQRFNLEKIKPSKKKTTTGTNRCGVL